MNIFQKYTEKDKLIIFLKRFLFVILLSIFTFFFFFKIPSFDILATNVLTNPSFTGGSTNWTLTGGVTYDSAVYQDSAGSLRGSANGRKTRTTGNATQSISTTITGGSLVYLNLYWAKQCVNVNCDHNQIYTDFLQWRNI